MCWNSMCVEIKTTIPNRNGESQMNRPVNVGGHIINLLIDESKRFVFRNSATCMSRHRSRATSSFWMATSSDRRLRSCPAVTCTRTSSASETRPYWWIKFPAGHFRSASSFWISSTGPSISPTEPLEVNLWSTSVFENLKLLFLEMISPIRKKKYNLLSDSLRSDSRFRDSRQGCTTDCANGAWRPANEQ